jgi:hypothetical protein
LWIESEGIEKISQGGPLGKVFFTWPIALPLSRSVARVTASPWRNVNVNIINTYGKSRAPTLLLEPVHSFFYG